MRTDLKKYVNKNCEMLSASNGEMSAVFEIMHRCPDNIFAEASDGFRIMEYTYKQIYDMAGRFASSLYSRIGANGEYVALAGENSPEWIAAFWGILKSGNKPFLVNMRHPDSLTQSALNTLGIKYFVGERCFQGCEYISYDELKCCDSILDNSHFENEFALSTSATSMKETICIYTGESVREQLLCTQTILSESDLIAEHYRGRLKLLAFLPFYHVFGLFAAYFWFGFFGRTFVFLRNYSPDTILKTCRKHEVTHIFAVPMLWHTIEKKILQETERRSEKEQRRFKKGLLFCTRLQNILPKLGQKASMRIMHEVTDKLFGRSIRFCISGGSYIKGSTLELINGIGYHLCNGYGMSELGIASVDLREKPSAICRNSVGRPFYNTEYEIRGGVLYAKTASSCKWIIKDGNKAEMQGLFCTGDTAYEENGYIYITGRDSDIVISENGENISPDTIEQQFTIKHSDAFSVLGLGEKENERISVVIAISRYLSDAQIKGIIQSVKEQNDKLPLTVRIRDFYFTYDRIMSETAIKVSRPYLKQAIENGSVSLIPFAEIKAEKRTGEADELTQKVIEIAAKTFEVGVEQITPETNVITDLGGTSMQYFSFLDLLAKEFKITDYSSTDTYRYRIADICDYLRERL